MGNPSFSYNNVKCFGLKELFGLFVANKIVLLGCSQFKLHTFSVILEFYKDGQSVLNKIPLRRAENIFTQ